MTRDPAGLVLPLSVNPSTARDPKCPQELRHWHFPPDHVILKPKAEKGKLSNDSLGGKGNRCLNNKQQPKKFLPEEPQ